jgi:hypothetical protein
VEWLELVFGGIGVAALGGLGKLGLWWLDRRKRVAPAPEPPRRSVVRGPVGADSAIRRVRSRGADHVLDGSMGERGVIEDIDFR